MWPKCLGSRRESCCLAVLRHAQRPTWLLTVTGRRRRPGGAASTAWELACRSEAARRLLDRARRAPGGERHGWGRAGGGDVASQARWG